MLAAAVLGTALPGYAHNDEPAAPPTVPSAQVPGSAKVDLTSDCLSNAIKGAIITNGTVSVGVNCTGDLNTPDPGDPLGIGYLGLRYVPTGAASTEPGCLCEGWGVANGAKSGPKTSTCAAGTEQGYANEANGTANVVVESFSATSSTAVAVVRVNNGSDLWRVTHNYHPSVPTPNLYEVEVTIENLSGVPKPTLYRRVMDWDIYPTPFNEFVTLNPGLASPTAKLFRMDNNGFNAGNPCSFGSYGITLEPGDPQVVDAGPADHGALFDFDFGTLAATGPGRIVTFRTYYGATADEASALTAVGLVSAENYSFGQPNVSNGDSTHGTPNTFIFAFGGVGAPSVFCGNGAIDAGEQCDDGNTTDCDGCDSNCHVSGCGSGKVCPPEQCDDGNTNDGDSCRNDCTIPVCGDGSVDGAFGETCDGSAFQPGAPAGAVCRGPADPQPCTFCGDGIQQAGEACDDGNLTDGDGCTSTCGIAPFCGDGQVNQVSEECDPPGSVSCPPGSPAGAFIVCSASCTCPECNVDANCDDSNACTTDSCVAGACVHDPNPNPPVEDCTNMQDDDCDLLVDCQDPSCGVPTGGVPVCKNGTADGDSCGTPAAVAACIAGGGTCACGKIEKDPSTIRFGTPGVKLDVFKSHGRVKPDGVFDLTKQTVAWVVSNKDGIVYRGVLLPGDLTTKDGARFAYLDRDARIGKGKRSGIYRATIRITRGGTYYGFKVQAYGDLSRAIDPNMAIQFYLADPTRSFVHDEPWTRRSWGWAAKSFE